jgi:hypothetical protein
MRNRLLRLLNIREDEAWLVSNLFWLQFFQGFAITIFWTVGLALFLEKFQPVYLPKAYLFSALLLWMAGFVYSKFEHAFSVKKLALGVILFIGISILLYSIGLLATHSTVLIFLIFCWYYVIYLLGNLEFWGVAALLFDIRQSKRLFTMIGSGDITAKLIGYLAVYPLVHITRSENLLLIAVLSILCSLFFYRRLEKAGKLNLHVKHEHQHHHHHHTQSVRDMLRGFFGNRMIASVAFLSFIVLTCVTIITYGFYAEIKYVPKTGESDKQLASFVSLFYTVGKIMAIVVRLIITGRLATILGTRGSLLVSPAILFALLVSIVAIPFFSDNTRIILYLFGFMAIITEVLKTSLQDPIFLSLMQPLSSHLRLKGHTVVKGFMDPFALAFSGVLLLGLSQIDAHINLLTLSYIVFGLLVVWVVMVFVVDREYVRTLVTALHKRYSVGNEINLNNEQTWGVLQNKISTGERGESIYILNLIEKQYDTSYDSLVLLALQHASIEVRMEAIKVVERKKIVAALPVIEEFIAAEANTALLPEAVKAKCMLVPDELESLDAYIEDKNPRLVMAAITGLMKSGGINAVVTAGQRLLTLIESDDAAERKMAATIIGDLEVQSFYKPLLTLLNDSNEEVVKAAITASGKVKNLKLIAPLMQLFVAGRYEKLITDALQQAGEVAIEEINQTLLARRLTRQQQGKLVMLCGRIGTTGATHMLDELVWKMPELRADIFHALHLCGFKPTEQKRSAYIELMRQYIKASTRLLFAIAEIEKIKTAKILEDALHIEMNELRDSLLLLFSFVYDNEKMLKAKNAFYIKRKESIANALEVIEIEVPKDISLPFIQLFEPGPTPDKCRAMHALFKEQQSYETVVDGVLNDTYHNYHRWTKAAALYSTIFYKGERKADWLNMARQQSDILLNQTAGKILAEMERVTGDR